jgi:pimeloyl-ACP methyl ester carboxylesterase
MVRQFIDEALESPHPTSMETMQRTMDVYLAHEDVDRLAEIRVPTLVLTGELDMICPPRHGRIVADGIPGAQFEILPGEAHQPFQESPEAFNRRVVAFWEQIDARVDERASVAAR